MALHAISPWLWCIPLLIFLLHEPRSNILAFMARLLCIFLPGKSIQDELGDKLLPEQCNEILNPLSRRMERALTEMERGTTTVENDPVSAYYISNMNLVQRITVLNGCGKLCLVSRARQEQL